MLLNTASTTYVAHTPIHTHHTIPTLVSVLVFHFLLIKMKPPPLFTGCFHNTISPLSTLSSLSLYHRCPNRPFVRLVVLVWLRCHRRGYEFSIALCFLPLNASHTLMLTLELVNVHLVSILFYHSSWIVMWCKQHPFLLSCCLSFHSCISTWQWWWGFAKEEAKRKKKKKLHRKLCVHNAHQTHECYSTFCLPSC